MHQLICNLRSGETFLEQVPAPAAEPGHILIRTTRTLVSQGTEKMLVNFGKASLLQKARSQPEKVRQVLSKIRADGLLPTVEAVFRRLDEPLPLGYCNCGTVIGLGAGAYGFSVGDRVASNGPHADIVCVPANLCAKVPSAVADDVAAFTVIGAIGLEGVRLIKPELGETVVVIGLGLIGQITAQFLSASGCHVIGFDYDRAKVTLAQKFGITAVANSGEVDPVRFVLDGTNGLGADAVIITASTSSNDVISQAAKMSRKRGRIVLVGVVGLQLNRADFYEKELTFQVSCSYGPGRYDDSYEEKGYDYPPGYVRWTENRNFQAVLEAMRTGALNVEPLITRRVQLERYREIYDDMDSGGLGALLVYQTPGEKTETPKTEIPTSEPRSGAGTTIKIGDRVFSAMEAPLAIVGAGNFTKMTVLPALDASKQAVKTIISAGGVTGTSLARKYNIPYSSTDLASVLNDAEVRGVIITTRHNLHATQAAAALKAGKHVFVEKPLCLSVNELRQIEAVVKATCSTSNGKRVTSNAPTLSVGFNRRFSPHVQKMKELLRDGDGPISVVATMNAGAIPLDHWVHDPDVGGGRLVGEACHFIDLAIFLTGSLVVSVSATALDASTDTASILLRHANGSNSVVNYFANGHRELSKERLEVHSAGRSLLLDNFRELVGYGFKSFSRLKTKQDKGHTAQFKAFAERVRTDGAPLIPWMEIANSARATLAIPIALRERRWVYVDELV